MMQGSDDDQQIGLERLKANKVVAALQCLAKKAAGPWRCPVFGMALEQQDPRRWLSLDRTAV